MAEPERFSIYQTGNAVALKDTLGSAFPPAGAGHGPGLVPDPGSTSHSPAFLLGDDGQFHSNVGPLLGAIDLQQQISGGGGVITSGNKGWLRIPCNATITNWEILADQSGSITVDILRANAAFPSSSIVGVGGNAPSLSSAQFAQAVPSSWTSTSLAAGDFVAFDVTGSPSSVTQVTVVLTCTRTS